MGRFSNATSAVVGPASAGLQVKPAPSTRSGASSKEGEPAATHHALGLLDAKIRVHNRLIDELDLSALDKLGDEDLKRQVRSIVIDMVREEGMAMSSAEINTFADAVFDEMTGLGPIEPLLADDSVSDIMINGAHQVYICLLYTSPSPRDRG